jgi:hypothetical protein
VILAPNYRLGKLATPHSRQRGLSREVINPQGGHILCDRTSAISGFGLRLQWSSRIVISTMSRPNRMLVAFMNATVLGDCCTKRDGRRSLAEKPKMREYFRWTGLGQKT